MLDWNPRYIHYALDHGRSPERQLIFDQGAYPGGCMAGFITWIDQKWREFEKAHFQQVKDTDRALFRYTYADAFDIWLQQ